MKHRTTDEQLAGILASNSNLTLRKAAKRPCRTSGDKDPQGIPESQPRAKSASVRHTPRVDYNARLVEILRFRGVQVEPEFKIFENRRFRADWRVVGAKVLIEFEGGLFHAGKQGHSSVAGILRDIEKYNLCAIDGWIVIRICPKHVDSGDALVWIEAAIEESTRPRYEVA